MYILELLNQEGEDTFLTSKHGHEQIVRTNWERKQTLPPLNRHQGWSGFR